MELSIDRWVHVPPVLHKEDDLVRAGQTAWRSIAGPSAFKVCTQLTEPGQGAFWPADKPWPKDCEALALFHTSTDRGCNVVQFKGLAFPEILLTSANLKRREKKLGFYLPAGRLQAHPSSLTK